MLPMTLAETLMYSHSTQEHAYTWPINTYMALSDAYDRDAITREQLDAWTPSIFGSGSDYWNWD